MSILADVTTEIIEWSKELMPWQRMILARLMSDQALSDTDRSEIFKRAKIDYGLESNGLSKDEIVLDAKLTKKPGSSAATRLVAISDVQGVNALRTGQQLKIGKQLTVIYGDNGSGKSGYSRILKRACSSKQPEPILGNVYEDAKTKAASCAFHCEHDGKPIIIDWVDGTSTNPDLKRFAVCDSKCAEVYVSSDNEMQFAPSIFGVFESLATETDMMKQRFVQLAETLQPREDALLPLMDSTSIGDMLSDLSARSDVKEIKKKARWGSADDKILAEKQAELAQIKTQNPEQIIQNLSAEKRRLELIKKHLHSLEQGISEQSLSTLKSKAEELAQLEAAAQKVAQQASGNSHFPDIGSKVWRDLVESAARYSKETAYPDRDFPFVGDQARCVLCQQSLEAEAKDRFESFWSLMTSEASSKRDRARRELDQMINEWERLPRSIPPDIAAIEEAMLPQNRPLVKQAEHYFVNAGKRIAAILAAVKATDFQKIPSLPISLLAGCDAAMASVDAQIADFQKQSAITNKLNALDLEVKELVARRRLFQNLKTVIRYIEELKKSNEAEVIANKIRTAGISRKSKELQTKYLTESYERAVQANIKSLGVRSARTRLNAKSSRGKVLHRVSLECAVIPAKTEAILSEGERTGVSLACFLAELGSPEETPGIILDDPVTSLDHKIRQNVVKRLVQEAKDRQVIIFTHDLVFYLQLLAEAKVEKVDVVSEYIESFSSAVGVVSQTWPWDALDVEDKLKKLDALIQQAKVADDEANPEEYRSKASLFYDYLRATWESAVEELLLNGVVQRYEKGVKTLKLPGVVIDEDGITAIYKGMTLSSAMTPAHSHAAAENKTTPTLDDMKEALTSLKEFVTAQRSKRKAALKQRAHLQP